MIEGIDYPSTQLNPFVLDFIYYLSEQKLIDWTRVPREKVNQLIEAGVDPSIFPDECNTCGDTGRWLSTTEDSPEELVDLGPCPDCKAT